jgi:hypothetical protein
VRPLSVFAGDFHVAIVDSQKSVGLNCSRERRLLQEPALANSVTYLAPASIGCRLGPLFLATRCNGEMVLTPAGRKPHHPARVPDNRIAVKQCMSALAGRQQYPR